MAMSRFDFEEVFRLNDILKNRFGSASCDGERVAIHTPRILTVGSNSKL